jgi:hypothetical protein
MDSNPTGKENVHAAASRFGFAGATKPKTTSASVATQKRTTSAGFALQSKDGAASADADPYNLRKMAIDAMPDDTEQYHEVTRKLKQANKGKAWDNKSKCAHAVRQTRAGSANGRLRAADCLVRADGYRAEKNDDLIRTMKELLNTMREQVRLALSRSLQLQVSP